MTAYVELTTGPSDKPQRITVNIFNLFVVAETQSGKAKLDFGRGDSITVHESYEELVSLIGAAGYYPLRMPKPTPTALDLVDGMNADKGGDL